MNEEVVQKVEANITTEVDPQEKADVQKWERLVMHARKEDRVFRQSVIRDRKFASGEALEGYEVKTNLVQATIDVLIPFLYAKDPDVDVVPQDQVSPPPVKRMPKPVPPTAAMDPLGNPMVAPDGVPITPDPQDIAAYAQQVAEYQTYQQQMQEQADADAERNDFIRRLSQTIEIVVSRLWDKARLKHAAKPWLRSSMTSAEGWLKVTMQGDLLTDPTAQSELYTVQQQISDITALEKSIAAGETRNEDEALASLKAKEAGLQAKVETYVAKCLAIDWIDVLDMQAPLSIRNLSDYVNAPWMADGAAYYSVEEAVSRFQDWGMTEKKLTQAARWKPPIQSSVTTDGQTVTNIAAYEGQADGWTKEGDSKEGFVRVWEIHSRQDNMIYTWVEGTNFWAKPPVAPRFPTTRFYPYFLLALYEVDGSRHSQSLSYRLSCLQEEFASCRSNQAEVRRRAKQGIIADGTNISPEDANKIRDGQNQEITYISPIRPGEPLGNSFAPKPYNSPDNALYDTAPIRSDIETVSGAQDALRGSVSQPKTATEAEIENSGTNARSGYSRDCLDEALNEMAQYTAELALGAFTREQVQEWAGPYAVWPQGIEQDKLQAMVSVAIRAGSSGKPNTSAERQAWAAILPQVTSLITQIGALQGADQQEMADKLKEVLRETVIRTGDKVDIDRFLPMASPAGAAAAQIQPSSPMQAPPLPTQEPMAPTIQ
jgi:hypothetical protein